MASDTDASDIITTGVLIISIFVILIGMGNSVSGQGVVIGCYLLSVTILVSVISSTFYITQLYSKKKKINVITTITIANFVLLGTLIYFIVILSTNTSNTTNPQISEYTKVYIEWFLITVVIICILNFSIKNILNAPSNSIPEGVLVLFGNMKANMIFLCAEVFILIAYVYIISLIFKRYPASG